MSDADSLKNDPGLLESPDGQPDPGHSQTDPGAVLAAPPVTAPTGASRSADADGWQTVDFPDAMRVDDIPWAEGDIPVMAITSYAGLVQQLQQENGQLRDRINHLEEAAAFSQLEARTDIFHQGDTQHHASESEPAPATVQRQQILVETLNEQLGSCQERIAQLEHECALTQQRFNDQVQQRLQAETTCRDLRTRLHRQQQQALQFKTALEKCLEMPAPAAQVAEPAMAAVSQVVAADGSVSLFVPKTSPVQPWSQPTDLDGGASSQGAEMELPKLSPLSQPKLSKLMEAELTASDPEVAPVAIAAIPSAAPLAEFVDLHNLVNMIFPDSPPSEPLEIASPEESQAIFSISPFLANASAATDSSNADPSAAELTVAPASADGPTLADANANDALWDNLAKLIYPTSPVDQAATEKVRAIARQSFWDMDSLTAGIDPGTDLESIAPSEAAAMPPSPQPMDLLQLASPAAEPLSFNLKQQLETSAPSVVAEAAEVPLSVPVAADTTTDTSAQDPSSPEPVMFMAAGPSPILYPLRPAKKLKSLAAVELPTFPQR